jgi:hypothetical protein
MEKNFAQTSMNARDQAPVESTLIATTILETTPVNATKVSKETPTMDVSTSTNAYIQTHVDLEHYVQTLRAVIAATALKVTTVMPDQLDV